MKLAVLIGVSDYSNISNLPACQNDVNLLNAILSSREGQKLLVVSPPTSATAVKQQLIEFITTHKDEEVEEFLFYYTGHGAYVDGEFYYLLSDYQKNKIRQTALANTELDGLIRTTDPELTCKIVDACRSGVPYIKDSDDLQLYMQKTQSAFKDCYFMFSSRSDEPSYQDKVLSRFTRKIGELIVSKTGPLRYKDVIDYVSDEFENDSRQTPYFVTQGPYTHQFCQVDAGLQNRIQGILLPLKQAPLTTAGTGTDLASRVKVDAEFYCTKEEAFAALTQVKDRLIQFDHPTEGSDLFDTVVNEIQDYTGLPDTAPVGKWFEDSTHKYFAKALKKKLRFKKLKTAPAFMYTLRSLGSLGLENIVPRQEDYTTVEEEVISGVSPTIDMPYGCVTLKMTPKYPNLNSTECFLLPFLSRTHLACFYAMRSYEPTGWEEEVPTSEIKWQLFEAEMKNAESLDGSVRNVVEEFWAFTLNPIKKKFEQGSDVETAATDTVAAPEENGGAEVTGDGDTEA
jgi:hypothetical protein